MDLVAVDIGGTHARFALAQVSGGRVAALGEPVTFVTAAHASLQAGWEAFGGQQRGPLPRAAAIAVAAPVRGDTLQLTNNDWVIHRAHIDAELKIDHSLVINDFEAIGHAVAQLRDSDFAKVCGPDGPLLESDVITVIGPGTGLGVAAIVREGVDYQVLATEGGHLDFAPVDAFEDTLLAELRGRHGAGRIGSRACRDS